MTDPITTDLIRVEARWAADAVPHPPFTGAPCVALKFTFIRPVDGDQGTTLLDGLNFTWALIDTGADRNMIDQSLIPADTIPIEDIISHGVNGSTVAGNYDISLYFEELSWSVKCGAISMLTLPNRPYGMILGRQFLQLVEFQYDGRVGIQHLRKIDNAAAH